MATWTVSVVDECCGGCGLTIPPNQPIALVTAFKKLRCLGCAEAIGLQVNATQVDDARFDIERQRRLALEQPLTPSQYVAQATSMRRRKLTPSGELATTFDPKTAAAGGDR